MNSVELTIEDLFEFLALEEYNTPLQSTEEIFVKSDKNTLVPVLNYIKKDSKPIYKCYINNDSIEVADTHIFRSNNKEIFAKDSKGIYLDTLKGQVLCTDVEFVGCDDVYDFEIPAPHWYTHNENFAGGLISHNTIFLSNIAGYAAMSAKNVAIFHMEESELEVRERLDAYLLHKNTADLKTAGGTLKTPFEYMISKGFGNIKIRSYGPNTASCMNFQAQLDDWKLQEGFVPDIIIVDSITIVKPNAQGSSDNLYSKGKAVSEEIKALGVTNNVPTVSSVQLGRGAYNATKVGMADVAEAIAISQIATTMIGVVGDEHRPDIRICSILKSRKMNKDKAKPMMVNANTEMQTLSDLTDTDKRMYIKAEQKEVLNSMNDMVTKAEQIEKEPEKGESILDTFLNY